MKKLFRSIKQRTRFLFVVLTKKDALMMYWFQKEGETRLAFLSDTWTASIEATHEALVKVVQQVESILEKPE